MTIVNAFVAGWCGAFAVAFATNGHGDQALLSLLLCGLNLSIAILTRRKA